MTDHRYTIPAAPLRIERTITKSLFIASCAHVTSSDEAKAFHQRIKDEFNDASHNCLAFVAGPPVSSLQTGMSDDGEPRGTAGHPMLSTLLHSGIREIAIVVTRYFGGVKLGTGGLVRAYSDMVKHLLNDLQVTRKLTGNTFVLLLDYKDITPVKRHVASSGGEIISETYTDRVSLEVMIPGATETAFIKALPFGVSISAMP